MDTNPAELNPAQVIYPPLVLAPSTLLGSKATLQIQEGVPVAATVDDRSTINTGINCITISDSDEDGTGETAAAGASMLPDGTGETAAAGASMVPTEPPFPPPQRGRASHEPPWRPPRRRSTSSDSEPERAHGKRRKSDAWSD